MLGLMTYLLLATRGRPKGNNKEYKMRNGILLTVVRAIDPHANRSLEAVFLFSLLGLTLTLVFTRLAAI
jgi:hypothetical protein